MKRKFIYMALLVLVLVSAVLFGSCGSKDEPRPKETSSQEKPVERVTVVAPEIEQPENDGTLVQSPAAYFARTRSADGTHRVDYISSEMVQAYMDLLVNELGFVLNDEDLSYVYNTWRFLMPGSGTDPGEYNVYNDVKVVHYYDSDWHDNTLEVTVNNENFRFADLGYRYTGENVEPISGERATDAYILKNRRYMNESDGLLRVMAGKKKPSSYSYTKPFASSFYTYKSVEGYCCLIVDGSEVETCSTLLCDFENFDSKENDMLIVWKENGEDLLKVRWQKDTFKSGETYNLNDMLVGLNCDVDIDYNGKTYTINSVDALTIRPLLLDRTGDNESLVYFYIEVGDGDGATALTLEGLAAAPFNLAENSKWTSSSSSSGSSSSGSSSDDYDPNVADFARLDCLTCGGDGDCNTCGGYGKVERYAGAGNTVTSSCSSCYGSGNCRTCGGSGKR